MLSCKYRAKLRLDMSLIVDIYNIDPMILYLGNIAHVVSLHFYCGS